MKLSRGARRDNLFNSFCWCPSTLALICMKLFNVCANKLSLSIYIYIYRSTTNTYFDNHKLGMRPIHVSTTNTYFDSHKLGMRPIHWCDLYTSIYGMQKQFFG